MANDMMSKIVGIAIALFMVAVLFPPALNELLGTSIEGAGSAIETLLYTFVPIMAIIGVAVWFIKDVRNLT